jgi:hypothetical protein
MARKYKFFNGLATVEVHASNASQIPKSELFRTLSDVRVPNCNVGDTVEVWSSGHWQKAVVERVLMAPVTLVHTLYYTWTYQLTLSGSGVAISRTGTQDLRP